MLVACAHLRRYYESSFAKYVMRKYETFSNQRNVSNSNFLNLGPPEWDNFVKSKPWRELMGIGGEMWDYIFRDIEEAKNFTKNTYKFDSTNRHFFRVTGIEQLIKPFTKEKTIEFLKRIRINYTLAEINKGIYTYCSDTHAEQYGLCRELRRCVYCKVNDICDKKINANGPP